jgi:uncharacterized protein (DUF1697 family)
VKPYVALLRAVNVSGQNKLPMAALRAELSARYDNVTTYVQSGNVVLTAATTPEAKLSRALEQDIRRTFGLSITVLVRTKEQLRAVTTHNPWLTRGAEAARLYVTFLAAKPSARQVQDLMAKATGTDEAAVRGREVYLHCPNGYGRTKLNNAFLERQLGAKATTRNWATVTKLLALASE